MKHLVLLIIVGLLSVQETKAKPYIITDILGVVLDGIGGTVKVAGNIVEGAIDATGDVAEGILDTAVDAVTGTIKIVTGTGSSIVGGAEDLIVASFQVVKEVLNSIDQVFTKQLVTFKSKVVQRAVNGFQKLISAMVEPIEQLSQMVDDKFNEANEKSDEYVEAKEKEWTEWGDKLQEQLEGSTDNVKQEGEDQIDAFIQASKAEVEDCTKGLIGNAEKISNIASDTVSHFLSTINAVLNKIKECSTIPISNHLKTAQCAAEIMSESQPLITAPVTIVKVGIELGTTSVGSVANLACIPKTMIQVKKNKKEVEEAISELAKEEGDVEEENEEGEEEETEEGNEEETEEEENPDEGDGKEQDPEEGDGNEEETEEEENPDEGDGNEEDPEEGDGEEEEPEEEENPDEGDGKEQDPDEGDGEEEEPEEEENTE